MEITIWMQIRILMWSAASGIAIGLIYDLFRVSRRMIKTGTLAQSIEDIAFFAIAAIVLFFAVYETNGGELRWFEFIASAAGLGIYLFFFSRFIVRISVKILEITIKAIVFFIKVVIYPIAFIYKIIKIPLMFIFKVFKRIFKYSGRRLGSGKKQLLNYVKNISKKG